jgi:hypothetical protein
MRALAFAALCAVLTIGSPVLAEGPGSRIGTTPQVPLPQQPVDPALTKKCDSLRGEERARCVSEARNAAPSRPRPSGPEATGMGSGAGNTAGSGTSGGASVGASGPR